MNEQNLVRARLLVEAMNSIDVPGRCGKDWRPWKSKPIAPAEQGKFLMMPTSIKARRLAIISLFMIAASAAFVLIYLFYFREPAPPQGVLITVERTACFGGCPVYRLSIYGSGEVVYEGYRFVEVEGTRTTRISERKVRELVTEFERIGFYQFDDHYAIAASDMPSIIVSINLEGRSKTIEIYGGGAPEALMNLVKQIEEAANVSRWVGKQP